MADLYRAHGVCSAAFLTAWNPCGERTAPDVNEEAQRRLERRLDDFAVAVMPGIGEDDSGKWIGEPSFLALGISPEEAERFGKEFRQNAIVWIGRDRVPALVCLRRSRTVSSN